MEQRSSFMDRKLVIDAVFKYLEQKKDLSALEEDIVSSMSKYTEQPFDRKGIEQKVIENNMKYSDIFSPLSKMPGMYSKPLDQLSDAEAANSLYIQIVALCKKEYTVMQTNELIFPQLHL